MSESDDKNPPQQVSDLPRFVALDEARLEHLKRLESVSSKEELLVEIQRFENAIEEQKLSNFSTSDGDIEDDSSKISKIDPRENQTGNLSPMNKKERYEEIEDLIRREIAHSGLTSVKIEGFGFEEFSSDLTNSITDQLYREFFPPLKKLHEEALYQGNSSNFRNDLDVSDIVNDLKSDISQHVKERLLISLRSRISAELEEQYHPHPDSEEHKVDERIKSIRKLGIFGYYFSAFAMLSLAVLIGVEAISLIVNTSSILLEAFLSLYSGNFLDLVDFSLRDSIVLSVLSILDLLLLGSLVILIIIGGYENTVSRMGKSHDVPSWFGSLGLTDYKIKVASLIVIISFVHLFTQYTLINPSVPNRVSPNLEAIMACSSDLKSLSQKFDANSVYTDTSAGEILRIERAHAVCQVAQNEQDKLKILSDAGIENADAYFDSVYSQKALILSTVIHIVFVLAALVLGFMGRLTSRASPQSPLVSEEAEMGKNSER